MTTYGAYDAGAPCKNSHCKSYGKPHPNCRCWPNLMAEGGEATMRCDGPHQPSCEYYQVNPPSPEDDVAAAFAHHGFSGLIKGVDLPSYLSGMKKGNAAIEKSLNSLFEGGVPDHTRDKQLRDKVHQYLERGGINQSLKEANYPGASDGYAKGGMVEQHQKSVSPIFADSSLAQGMPAHNLLLNSVKARVANHLNSLRPETKSLKLPFDAEPDHTPEKRAYHQAIDLANNPLSILGEIGKGTIEADHVTHLRAMSPELTSHLQKRIGERVLKAQMDDKKPSYKLRQGLSMFMGSPLSSEMTPQSIMAAQATFMPMSPQEPQPAPKKKRSTSNLSKADEAYLTGSQAREKREQE